MSSNLKEIRVKIDKVDTQILIFLEKRFNLAMRTKALKKKVVDTHREKEIIENLLKRSENFKLLNSKFVKKIFKSIISESKRIQRGKTANS